MEFGLKLGFVFWDKMFFFLLLDIFNLVVFVFMIYEYNYVCWLEYVIMDEKDEILFDIIMMEGLVEYVVYECFGLSFMVEWMFYYMFEQFDFLFEKRVKLNFRLMRDNRMFFQLLYGKGYFFLMFGYVVGFNIVKKYLIDY